MSMIGNLLRVTNAELQEYLKDSSLLEDRIYSEENDNPNLVYIDKAWEGIVFLLTGQCLAEAEHPLLAVLFSGQIVDDAQDLGYGPAHYVTPEKVLVLNDEISKITVVDLQQKFDPIKMAELGVYPEIWDAEDHAFDYLSEYFLSVQKVYRDAASCGDGIITFID